VPEPRGARARGEEKEKRKKVKEGRRMATHNSPSSKELFGSPGHGAAAAGQGSPASRSWRRCTNGNSWSHNPMGT